MAVQSPTRHFLPDVQRPAASVFTPIQREFDRLFDRLGDGWSSLGQIEVAPRMDVKSHDGGYEITVELPGVGRDDVKVSVEDDVLTISGDKKTETETKEGDYRISERSYGAFCRSVALPTSVDADKIEASLRDGVLTLKAPRSGEAKSKTIKIKRAA